MSGWRDADGRTANERRKTTQATDRARFAERLRNRPLSFVKPALGAVLVAILILALLNFFG